MGNFNLRNNRMTKTKKYYEVQISVDSWVPLIVERDKEMSKDELISSITKDELDELLDQFELWEPDYKDIRRGFNGQNDSDAHISVEECNQKQIDDCLEFSN